MKLFIPSLVIAGLVIFWGTSGVVGQGHNLPPPAEYILTTYPPADVWLPKNPTEGGRAATLQPSSTDHRFTEDFDASGWSLSPLATPTTTATATPKPTPGTHNVLVYQVYTSPARPMVGQRTAILFTICNNGDYWEHNVTFNVYVAGVRVATGYFSDIPQNACAMILPAIYWTPTEAVPHLITVTAGPVPGETKMDDNILTISVPVQPAGPTHTPTPTRTSTPTPTPTPALHDIAILNAITHPAIPTAASPAQILVGVKNQGLVAETSLVVQGYLFGELKFQASIDRLAAGEIYTVTLRPDWVPADPGTYSLTVSVPPRIDEAILSNNVLTLNVKVDPQPTATPTGTLHQASPTPSPTTTPWEPQATSTPTTTGTISPIPSPTPTQTSTPEPGTTPGAHDMAVIDLYTIPAQPGIGTSVDIVVVIKNLGSVTEPSVTLTLYVGQEVIIRSFGPIPPGQEAERHFPWIPGKAGNYTLEARVSVPADSDPGNNSRSIVVVVPEPATPTETAIPTITASPTATPSPTTTPAMTHTASLTPTATWTPTLGPTPTATPSLEPSPTSPRPSPLKVYLPLLSRHENPFAGYQMLVYDDWEGNQGWSVPLPAGAAVRFTPPSTPWSLHWVQFSGRYDDQSSYFVIEVWDANQNELFHQEYLYSEYFTPGEWEWTLVQLPDIPISGDFYVAIFPNHKPGEHTLYISEDTTPPISLRSYFVNMDANASYGDGPFTDLNWMIRAIGRPAG